MNAHLNRPQLLVGYDKKILIYKYDGANLLDMHLSYTNHYDIVEMELISDMHILIRSH